MRELLQRLLKDLDLRLRAVSSGVAWAQHPRQRLAALIQIRKQRMKPKGPLKFTAVPSFSLCAPISVASMSITIRCGRMPSPQARSRA